MIKLCTILLVIATLSMGTSTQIKATTSDGKTVLLNSNGTWEYEKLTVKPQNSGDNSFECSDLIVTETDKVTGRATTTGKEVLVISNDGGKSGFGILLMKSKKSIIVSITVAGAGGCIDDTDKMNILFKDGSRLEMTNNGKFNCKSKFTLYLGGMFGQKKQLEAFRTKEIETMRVWTSKGYVEEDFSLEEGKIFMKTIDCLLK